MSQPFKLYRLQQIDSQLDRARARLQQIEVALSEDAALRQAEDMMEKAAAALEAERKTLRRAEQDVQEQRLKIEQTEATLYSGKVRNPKELQDMQSEAAALKRFRSTLEDRQLESMIAVEEAEASHQTAVAAFENARTESTQMNRLLLEEQSGLNGEVSRLEGERVAAASSISPEDIRLYDQLRAQRRGIAVAKVADRACSACGSTLNAALLQAARSPSQIARCDTCGRILYSG